MPYYLSEETEALLNAIGENIFIVDNDLNIVWINDYSEDLIKRLSPYTRLETKKECIGKNIKSHFIGESNQMREMIDNVHFPYETTIDIFSKFSASIALNPYIFDGERKGFVLTWADVTEYESELRKSKVMIEEMYAPIMETCVDGVYHIPVVGSLNQEQFKSMKKKIMKICDEHHANVLIFDFTGLTSVSQPDLMVELKEIKIALSLMGVQPLICGIRSSVANQIAKYRMTKTELKSFPNFKQAIRYVWESRGCELVKKGE